MGQNQTLLCYVYVIPVILVLFSKLSFVVVISSYWYPYIH